MWFTPSLTHSLFVVYNFRPPCHCFDLRSVWKCITANLVVCWGALLRRSVCSHDPRNGFCCDLECSIFECFPLDRFNLSAVLGRMWLKSSGRHRRTFNIAFNAGGPVNTSASRPAELNFLFLQSVLEYSVLRSSLHIHTIFYQISHATAFQYFLK